MTAKYYTLREAAKATGVSRTTIHNALKSGKISYANKTSSGYKIEPSELFRVFEPVNKKTANVDTSIDDSGQLVTHIDTKSETEIALLREILQREKDNASYLKEQISDLQKDRDQWRQQAQQVTYLLEDKRDKKEALLNDSWFKRIFKI